jgi:hypothetical protein
MSKALMITIFLIMYWPTRVRENGASEKEISGKNTTGIKVNTRWVSAAMITILGRTFKIKHSPIPTSITANINIPTFSGMR